MFLTHFSPGYTHSIQYVNKLGYHRAQRHLCKHVCCALGPSDEDLPSNRKQDALVDMIRKDIRERQFRIDQLGQVTDREKLKLREEADKARPYVISANLDCIADPEFHADVP
jgi:hypothetical protein